MFPIAPKFFARPISLLQVLCYGSNDKTGEADLAAFASRAGADRISAAARLDRDAIQQIAATGVTSLFRGVDAAHHARAEHGRALLDGHDLRIQGGVDRGRIRCREFFPMLTTAAGTITPARVLVIGAGVAGLQAIATARRLGAVASAYDMRPAAKEQVQSLGGRFVELPIEAKDAQDARGYGTAQDEEFYQRQRELLGNVVAESDVVITAAVMPGKKSPVLVTADMVKGMAPGSVIVDLAAERGGNCELTRPGEKIVEHGVTIIGWYQPGQHRSVPRQPDVRAQRHRVSSAPGQGRKAATR